MQGTGVWRGLKLAREPKEEEEKQPADTKRSDGR